MEKDIKAKVNESFIGKLKNYELIWSFDTGTFGSTVMNFSVAVLLHTDKELRLIGVINKHLITKTIGQLTLKHYVCSDARPREMTMTHETTIRNRYGLIVDHTSDTVISSFQSVVHAFNMNPIKGN